MSHDSREPFVKRLVFLPVNDHGEEVITPIGGSEAAHVKLAARADLMPKVAEFIRSIKPDPQYRYVLINALGAGEKWGCFPAGTPVLLADGREVSIEEVQVGDVVQTHEGRRRPVEKIWRRPHEDGLVQPILTSTLPGPWMTGNHPVFVVPRDEFLRERLELVYKRDYEAQTVRDALAVLGTKLSSVMDRVPAEHLQAGDRVALPFEVRVDETAELSGHAKARLLGYYAAEGCPVRRNPRGKGRIKRASNRTEPYVAGSIFVIGSVEENFRDEIVSLASSLGYKVSPRPANNGAKAVRLELGSVGLSQLFVRHTGVGATKKCLSPQVKRMPHEWQLAFLGAYFNGDGCVREDDSRYSGVLRMTTASRQLAFDVQELCWRLGMRASVCEGKQGAGGYGAAGTAIYEISVGSTDAKPLLPHVDAPESRHEEDSSGPFCIVLDRERGFAFVPIKGVVQKAWSGEVFNIQVAQDHSYVAGRLVVGNSNKNGDWFPEAALRHEGADYGYKTFLKAGVYKHHINKDKTKSAGRVVLSEYNKDMHRVELVVRFDADKDPDVTRMIDDGTLFAVSMGCRVPSDHCSICGHESKTTADYCPCLTDDPGMNEIEESTGKRAFAINLQPHFFDISRVLVGADRTARSYGKVASASEYPDWLFVPSGELAEKMGDVKGAAIDKLVPADEMHVLSEPARDLAAFKKAPLDALRGNPYAIDVRDLKKVAHLGVAKTFSTFAALGIPLNAREFQYLALTKIGQNELAESLDRVGYRIQPTSAIPELLRQSREVAAVDISHIDPLAMKLAAAYVSERSVHLPFVLERMTKSAGTRYPVRAPDMIVPSLHKIAVLYAAYLENLAAFGPAGLTKAASLPEIRAILACSVDPVYSLTPESPWVEKVASFGDSHPVRDYVTGVLLSQAYDSSDVSMDADTVHRKIARSLPDLTSARVARLHPETSAWVTVLRANSMTRG